MNLHQWWFDLLGIQEKWKMGTHFAVQSSSSCAPVGWLNRKERVDEREGRRWKILEGFSDATLVVLFWLNNGSMRQFWLFPVLFRRWSTQLKDFVQLLHLYEEDNGCGILTEELKSNTMELPLFFQARWASPVTTLPECSLHSTDRHQHHSMWHRAGVPEHDTTRWPLDWSWALFFQDRRWKQVQSQLSWVSLRCPEADLSPWCRGAELLGCGNARDRRVIASCSISPAANHRRSRCL